MSATFKLSKQKPTQNELRRLMNEHKAKATKTETTTKIDSPLAKYPFLKLKKKKQFILQHFSLFVFSLIISLFLF